MKDIFSTSMRLFSENIVKTKYVHWLPAQFFAGYTFQSFIIYIPILGKLGIPSENIVNYFFADAEQIRRNTNLFCKREIFLSC